MHSKSRHRKTCRGIEISENYFYEDYLFHKFITILKPMNHLPWNNNVFFMTFNLHVSYHKIHISVDIVGIFII